MAIEDEAALREIVPDPPQRAWAKEQPVIDEGCAEFIAASPFAVLATASGDGRCDASPRGGPPGFATVLDPGRLALPDYSGNRRQDSHRNLIENPYVGLVFFVPGVKESLRVIGRAELSTDPSLLASLVTGGQPPKVALVIEVETAFIHCGKALHRSELWDPSTWPSGVSLVRARARAAGETEEEVRVRWRAGFEDPKQLW
jgi:PPOX class probable FMN-dependent enzyme